MNNEKYFFAAANGYSGFISYFDKVFVPSEFEKIYILKGGPGTGKSSLMKTVKVELENYGCDSESIYCSSDPKSLDGIICEKSGKKIAILDGTAPHERDASIPGAIEEIVNLGESWDSRFLTAEREGILNLNKEKKKAYKTAYSYLKICGDAANEKQMLFAPKRNCKKLKLEVNYKAESKNPTNSTRLISSFGKYGKYRLNTFEEISENSFSIIGEEECCYKLMEEIYEAVKKRGFGIIHSPSPLDAKKTEAIYIPESKTSYTINGGGKKITADKYFIDCDKADRERIRVLSELYTSSLSEAERWFNIASDFHFRLEDIYTRCMNFENNNRIIRDLLPTLRNCLDL